MRAPRFCGALSMLLLLGSLVAASLAAAPTPDWPHYGVVLVGGAELVVRAGLALPRAACGAIRGWHNPT